MKRIDKAIRAYMMSGKAEGETAASDTLPATPKKRATGLGKPSGGGVTRAAKLLMLLEQDAAAEILKHLSENEIEKITKEIADTGKVDRGEAHRILEDFHVKQASVAPVSGGTELAKEMLVNTFGSERGLSLYRRAVPIEIDNPFDFLDDLDFQQILMLLKKESGSVVSVILPYMASRTASQVLEALPPELQMKVVKRIARMEKISPDALMRVAEALREKIRKQGTLVTEEVDGPNVLADILANMSADAERDILEELDGDNPELVEHIRDRLFTIDVVFFLSEQDLQAVLREFAEEEIAVVLKGKTEEIRERILDNVSARRRSLVVEEGERLGPMKRREVEKATREFVAYVRELADEGRILLHRNQSDVDEMV
jgi:flagellar motor switch protein FliG